MKLNFAATNADVRGGGFRTGFNLVKVQDINHSHKPDAQRNISPLVLKCSSIQQAKMKLKSAQEGRQRLSPEILRKTKEDLFSQTDRPWPFKETPPNSVEETRPNFSELIKPNALAPLIKSNLENLRTLQEESTIVEEQDKTFLPMRTSPRETEANEEKDSLKKRASSQPLVGPLHTILPKDLARTGAMRRLINQSIVKTRRETTKFNKTVQGFLGSQPKNFNSDRNLHTSQADLMRTKSQLGSLLTNHKVAQKKEENGAYPQINHTSYQHHKFQRTLQRSFITNMPPKKSLVYIFHNKKDTIEKTIQDLQIKRLHFKDDFVDSEMLEMKVKGMRRSRSVQGFRKSLELAKIQQVENSSQKILAEEKKKQLRKDGNEHKSASQKTLKTQAGDETALLDPQGGLPIITGESNKIAMISDSEYFRKTYIKEFKIGPDGKYNGNNPSLKNKILKQEFAYYSELTQRMLDDLSSNLQEAALGGYSYEEYKVLKSNFSNILTYL